jgi:GNAT superfamily N-acetyltransferase
LGQQNIDFGLATVEDAREMVDFHNRFYGHFFGSVRDPEYWIWEFRSYEPEKSMFISARDEGKLIGTTGITAMYVDIGDKCVLAARGRSALLLPEYRGADVYFRLFEYLITTLRSRGMAFLWGWTATPKLVTRLGFHTGPDIDVLVRPGSLRAQIAWKLREDTRAWRRIGSVCKATIYWFLTTITRSNPRVKPREGYELIKEGTIDEGLLQGLLERMKSGHDNIVSIRYDEEFLRWRIREHPLQKYDEYQVLQGGELRAYAFVTLSEGTVSISEIISEDDHATALLLSAILKDYSRKAGRYRIIVNPEDCLVRNLSVQLRRFGFKVDERMKKPLHTAVMDLADIFSEDLYDFRYWHVTALWFESTF